jgi:EAL domain-containing protein (putative c-di-GMP-specific phosphodiesterase class I)
MYQAKDSGRNTYHIYSRELTDKAVKRVSLVSALHDSLARHELMLHYQPQFDLRTGQVCGVEALIRWQRPESGLVPPAEFINVAEETGIIVPIGEWVLREACRQMKAWQDGGLLASDMPISVNISGRQFDQGNLIGMVTAALRDNDLPPDCLELEITESTMMRSTERSSAVLKELRALGTKLAIDDFGVGYSSLAYLKRLPITRLKIDRGFITEIPRDPDDVAIARAIIALGRALSLDVLAEGVETEQQKTFLLHEGCHTGQGFAFARPMPVPELEPFLTRSRVLVA